MSRGPAPARVLVYALGAALPGAAALLLATTATAFLVDVAGLPPYTAGGVLLAGRAVAATLTPLLGYVSDNFVWRTERRRPILCLAAPVAAALFVLLWRVPLDAPVDTRAAYFFGVYALFECANALYALNYDALTSEMTVHADDRARVVAARLLVGVLAGLAVGLASPSLVGDPVLGPAGAIAAKQRYTAGALAVALVGFALALPSLLLRFERDGRVTIWNENTWAARYQHLDQDTPLTSITPDSDAGSDSVIFDIEEGEGFTTPPPPTPPAAAAASAGDHDTPAKTPASSRQQKGFKVIRQGTGACAACGYFWVRLCRDWMGVMSQRSFALLSVMNGLLWFAIATLLASLVFYARLADPDAPLMPVMGALQGGIIGGLMLVSLLGRRATRWAGDRRPPLAVAIGVMVVACAATLGAGLTTAGVAALGLACAWAVAALQAMVPEVVDEGESRDMNGARRDGTYYAFFATAGHSGAAAAGLYVGAAVAQPERFADMVMLGPICAGAALLVPLYYYPAMGALRGAAHAPPVAIRSDVVDI